MLPLLLPLAWRNLWRNPRRTLITLIVVSVGLWSILTWGVLLAAWSDSTRDTTLGLMTGEGQIHAPGYLDDPGVTHSMMPPGPTLTAILASERVKAYAPRVRVSAILQSEYRTQPVTLVGVVPRLEGDVSIIPGHIAQGRYLDGSADQGIVLGRDMAKRLKTRVGKRVVLMTQTVRGRLAERAFEVVGLFEAPQDAEDSFAFTGIRVAQAVTGLGDRLSEIALDAPSESALPGLLAALRSAAPALDVSGWKTLAPFVYAIDSFSREWQAMWLWMMFALMAIGIVNTQLMAVAERTRELGLLMSLGMRPRLVLLEVTVESALLIAGGVVLGVVFAILSVHAFPNGLNLGFLGRGAELTGAGRILYPRVDSVDFARSSAIVWALCVLAALWPAGRAARISPQEVMRRAPI